MAFLSIMNNGAMIIEETKKKQNKEFEEYKQRIEMANECNYPALMALRNKMAKQKTKKKEISVF